MKKRVLALILGGTMLAAGTLSFVGCGHKHTYAISYQLADCDTEGYTRHTCTTCGYVYADEFIDPYGHALSYTFHVIYPDDDTPQAVSRASNLGDSHYQLNVTYTEEELQELKDKGAEICIHRECKFCNYETPEGDKLISPTVLFEDMDWFCNPSFAESHADRIIYVNVPPYYRTDSGELAPSYIIEESVLSPTISASVTITMPDTIEIIEERAFNYIGVARIYLSKKLRSIGPMAFGMVEIPWIVIPRTVQYIGHWGLGPCEKTRAILYDGTWDEWRNIKIMDANLRNTTLYYYSETKPLQDGYYWRYVEGEPAIWPSSWLPDWTQDLP